MVVVKLRVGLPLGGSFRVSCGQVRLCLPLVANRLVCRQLTYRAFLSCDVRARFGMGGACSASSPRVSAAFTVPVTVPPTFAWADSPEFEPTPSFFDDDEFPSDLPSAVWSVVSRLRSVSSLLSGADCSALPATRCADIATKAIKGRLRSASSIKSALGHVASFLDFFSDSELSDTAEIAGNDSVLALHDFFESLHVRGQTVPRTARSALSVFNDALGAPWPLEHPLIVSAVAVDDPTPPKQAPSFPLALVIEFDAIASDPLVASGKRLLASAILLMALTSLRFADVQRLKALGANESSVYGTLLSSKTKRPHGLDWPFAAPISGFNNSPAWLKPVRDFRAAFVRTNGVEPSFLIPKLSFRGILNALRRFRIVLPEENFCYCVWGPVLPTTSPTLRIHRRISYPRVRMKCRLRRTKRI